VYGLTLLLNSRLRDDLVPVLAVHHVHAPKAIHAGLSAELCCVPTLGPPKRWSRRILIAALSPQPSAAKLIR